MYLSSRNYKIQLKKFESYKNHFSPHISALSLIKNGKLILAVKNIQIRKVCPSIAKIKRNKPRQQNFLKLSALIHFKQTRA